jgi:DNA-binding NarL/FixJ family response regulator
MLTEVRQRCDALTPRERTVMSLVVAGWRNKQIAGKIQASEATVKVHRTNLMRKMQASDRRLRPRQDLTVCNYAMSRRDLRSGQRGAFPAMH